MNTEATETKQKSGWVLYDADCRFCARLAQRLKRVLAEHGFELLPLQTPWVCEQPALAEPQLVSEMRLLLPDGRIFGGADAVVEISRYYWWAWPLRQVLRVPPGIALLRAGYRWIARHRVCANGACRVGDQPHEGATRNGSRPVFDFLLLLILPLLMFFFRTRLPSWVFRWAMAFALYAGCKGLANREGAKSAAETNIAFVYLPVIYVWAARKGGRS